MTDLSYSKDLEERIEKLTELFVEDSEIGADLKYVVRELKDNLFRIDELEYKINILIETLINNSHFDYEKFNEIHSVNSTGIVDFRRLI